METQTSRKGVWVVVLVMIFIFISTFLIPAYSQAQSSDLTIGNYQLLNQLRVGRTVYEYTYQVNITNNGTSNYEGVTATLSSSSPYTTVIDPHVVFGDVNAGQTIWSADTFAIRVDRLYPFNQAQLSWSVHVKPLPGAYNPPPSNIVDIVRSLPENATLSQLLPRLDELLGAAMSITRRDMPLMREAIMVLRGQPQIVKALYQKYQSVEDFGRRRQIIAIIGELQHQDPDTLSLLIKEIVWKPLPDVPDVPEGLSSRNYEEMIQMKAVEGIAFFRGADGAMSPYAIEQLENIMLTHPSQSVRKTAIDAYMWNQGDSADAASRLYQILPVDLHPYVEMPRFSSGANREAFERKLNDWRTKWATK